MAKFHQGQPSRLDALDTEILTVGTEAVGLNPPAQGNILGVFVEIQGQPVRWMPDGTNPTAATGFLLKKDDTATFFIDPSKIKFIRDAAATGDATVVVAYLGV